MTEPAPQKAAVVLISGGLDSTTTLALAVAAGYAPYGLSFAYGQRQAIELAAAARAARRFGCVAHRVVQIDLGAFGGSALTDPATHAVPKHRSAAEIEGTAVPLTYVPARNTVFLAYALAWAEVLGAFDLFIGATQVDASAYPDCRPAFIDAFAALANMATARAAQGEGTFRVHAPLMHWPKAKTIQTGLALGVDYGETHSCYDPVGALACGGCDACILRRRGFAAAGVPDPTRYVEISPES